MGEREGGRREKGVTVRGTQVWCIDSILTSAYPSAGPSVLSLACPPISGSCGCSVFSFTGIRWRYPNPIPQPKLPSPPQPELGVNSTWSKHQQSHLSLQLGPLTSLKFSVSELYTYKRTCLLLLFSTKVKRSSSADIASEPRM